VRRWLREPLLHFVAFGLIVFALQRPPDDPRRVVVDDAVIAELTRQARSTLEREPTPDDVDHAVRRWVREEMLVREARARGLDRGDPMLRRHLAEKMGFVLAATEVPDAPPDAELRALYAQHRDEFRVEPRLTLRHLVPAEADAVLARLQAGEDPRGIDAPTPGGPVLRGRTPSRLAQVYGEPFAAGLESAPLDAWHRRTSPHGVHLVRIEARTDGRDVGFEEARERLLARWMRQRLATVEAEADAAIEGRYEVVGWPR
jgi:hypothetical protein